MADDLTLLETWCAPLLAKLTAGQRTQVARKIGQALRRSQHQRIVANRAPDGGSYLPRKRRAEPLRAKKGRIKRKRDAMFQRIGRAAYLKVQASPSDVSVGFFGRVARIARVHQEGRTDRINREGRTARYPVRELLGFTQADTRMVRDLLIEHLAQ